MSFTFSFPCFLLNTIIQSLWKCVIPLLEFLDTVCWMCMTLKFFVNELKKDLYKRIQAVHFHLPRNLQLTKFVRARELTTCCSTIFIKKNSCFLFHNSIIIEFRFTRIFFWQWISSTWMSLWFDRLWKLIFIKIYWSTYQFVDHYLTFIMAHYKFLVILI